MDYYQILTGKLGENRPYQGLICSWECNV